MRSVHLLGVCLNRSDRADNGGAVFSTNYQVGFFAGLRKPLKESLDAMAGGGFITAIFDKYKLHMLYRVGNEDTKGRRDDCGVGETQQLGCLGFSGSLVAQDQMNWTPAILLKMACFLMVKQKWLAHQFPRRGDRKSSRNGMDTCEDRSFFKLYSYTSF